MMKEKLFYLLPLLALASCGEPSYKYGVVAENNDELEYY